MFMPIQERVLLIIDGNNFYHRLQELSLERLLSFDYTRFTKFLTGQRQVMACRYYIGAIREERGNLKSRELMVGQQKLVGRLQKHGFELCFGHMLKADGYHEKGVDVQMAVDMLVGAYENLKVRVLGKKVEYIGFSHKPSYALITHSDIRRLLTKEEMEQYIITEG